MYDWKEKIKPNQFAISAVILQAPSQVTSLLAQFSVQQFGYFSILMRLYFLKTETKSQTGWGTGEVSKQLWQRGRDRNVINNSVFLFSNKISEWHQNNKAKTICNSLSCHSITFHVALCQALLFASCGSYKNQEHISQPCMPTVPPPVPPECLPPAQECRPGLAQLAAQLEPH